MANQGHVAGQFTADDMQRGDLPVDDDENATAGKQRYHVSVPKPLARINLGTRFTDPHNDFANNFGYEGISIQSGAAHLFIDVNKRTLFQSGAAVTFQAGTAWFQYSSGPMAHASLGRMTVAANNKVVIAAGAGQGLDTAMDYGNRPVVRKYNGLLLEDVLQRQVSSLHAFFDGCGHTAEKAGRVALPATVAIHSRQGKPASKVGPTGFWKLFADMHEGLGHQDAGIDEEIKRIKNKPGGDGILGVGSMSPDDKLHDRHFPLVSGYSPYKGLAGYAQWAADMVVKSADLIQDNVLMNKALELANAVYDALEIYQLAYKDCAALWEDAGGFQGELEKHLIPRWDTMFDKPFGETDEKRATVYSAPADEDWRAPEFADKAFPGPSDQSPPYELNIVTDQTDSHATVTDRIAGSGATVTVAFKSVAAGGDAGGISVPSLNGQDLTFTLSSGHGDDESETNVTIKFAAEPSRRLQGDTAIYVGALATTNLDEVATKIAGASTDLDATVTDEKILISSNTKRIKAIGGGARSVLKLPQSGYCILDGQSIIDGLSSNSHIDAEWIEGLIVLRSPTEAATGVESRVQVQGNESVPGALGLDGATDVISQDANAMTFKSNLFEVMKAPEDIRHLGRPGYQSFTNWMDAAQKLNSVVSTLGGTFVEPIRKLVKKENPFARDRPPWFVGLFAPRSISLGTEEMLFGGASQGIYLVADGGRGDPKRGSGSAAVVTRGFITGWAGAQLMKTRPERKVSLGFRVRSDSDVDLRTRDVALLSAVSTTALARLESNHIAEVVSKDCTVISARGQDQGGQNEGGEVRVLGESLYIGEVAPDALPYLYRQARFGNGADLLGKRKNQAKTTGHELLRLFQPGKQAKTERVELRAQQQLKLAVHPDQAGYTNGIAVDPSSFSVRAVSTPNGNADVARAPYVETSFTWQNANNKAVQPIASIGWAAHAELKIDDNEAALTFRSKQNNGTNARLQLQDDDIKITTGPNAGAALVHLQQAKVTISGGTINIGNNAIKIAAGTLHLDGAQANRPLQRALKAGEIAAKENDIRTAKQEIANLQQQLRAKQQELDRMAETDLGIMFDEDNVQQDLEDLTKRKRKARRKLKRLKGELHRLQQEAESI